MHRAQDYQVCDDEREILRVSAPTGQARLTMSSQTPPVQHVGRLGTWHVVNEPVFSQ